MNDLVIAFIRTWVPTIAGAIATWLLSLGIEIDSAALAGIFFSVLSGIYCLTVRLLAEKWSWVGNLLGVNKAPVYEGTHRA